MKYGLKTLLFHSFFERQKVEINKYNNRLQNLWKLEYMHGNLLKLRDFTN